MTRKTDFIFTGAAGSCLSERDPVPLRVHRGWGRGQFSYSWRCRFLMILTITTARSTETAVCHDLFPAKNTQVISAAPYYDGCCPSPCAEGSLGAALCLWGCCPVQQSLEAFSCCKTWILQLFFWFCLKRSRVVSFGAGFSVCYFSRSARPAEKSRYSRRLRCIAAAIFLRTIPFLLTV